MALEVFKYFAALSLTGFGGPIVHIARMRQELVQERRWFSSEEFAHMLALAQLVPGPTSTQLAMHCGWRRAGLPGFLLAGLGFIAPAAILVALLAQSRQLWLNWWAHPAIRGLEVGAVALVVCAALTLAQSTGKTKSHQLIILLALALHQLGCPESILLFALPLSACLGQLRPAGLVAVLAGLGLVQCSHRILLGSVLQLGAPTPLNLGLVFSHIGLLLYGTGQVLLAYLQTELVVGLGWFTSQQLLESVLVGQITPGPLFTTATYIGFLLGGGWGALCATIGIFWPSFAYVALGRWLSERLGERIADFQSYLAGVQAASCGLFLSIAWHLLAVACFNARSVAHFGRLANHLVQKANLWPTGSRDRLSDLLVIDPLSATSGKFEPRSCSTPQIVKGCQVLKKKRSE